MRLGISFIVKFTAFGVIAVAGHVTSIYNILLVFQSFVFRHKNANEIISYIRKQPAESCY
jgi:hypothetical protein